jgi:hypothetical protein
MMCYAPEGNHGRRCINFSQKIQVAALCLLRARSDIQTQKLKISINYGKDNPSHTDKSKCKFHVWQSHATH